MAGYVDVRCQCDYQRDWKDKVRKCRHLLFQGTLIGKIRCHACKQSTRFGVSSLGDGVEPTRCDNMVERKWSDKPEPCNQILFEGAMTGEIKCPRCSHISHFQHIALQLTEKV